MILTKIGNDSCYFYFLPSFNEELVIFYGYFLYIPILTISDTIFSKEHLLSLLENLYFLFLSIYFQNEGLNYDWFVSFYDKIVLVIPFSNHLSLRIVNNLIYQYIMNRKLAIPLLLSAFILSGWAQQGNTVKGQVKDSSGNPVIGATVVIKGTTVGTTTDLDGNYAIEVSPGQELDSRMLECRPLWLKWKTSM